jgi:hypothetical protein
MLFQKVTKRCSAQLTRAQAQESLERQFSDSEIIALKRRGNQWVATLLQPHVAEFPPKDDDSEDEGPVADTESPDESSDSAPDESDSPDGDSDGPPSPDKGESEGSELHQLMSLVHEIAAALGIGGPAVPGADDMPMGPPDAGPPPPPPHGGMDGKQHVVHERALKPGEAAPGTTPIGAPAFASVAASHQAAADQLARMASFDAFDDTPGKTVKQAHAELSALYGPYGFQVRQIKRVEGGRRLAAKLSRR